MNNIDLLVEQAKGLFELAQLVHKQVKTIHPHLSRYSKPSIEGKKYELQIHNVLKHTSFLGKPFHIQTEDHLGGCSNDNDIICQYNDTKIGIEAKKSGTPDWMQCTIKYNPIQKKWFLDKGKIPDQCKNIFNTLLTNTVLFHDHTPPFLEKQMTHQEWLDVKRKTTVFNDMYIDIPNDTISKLYKAKGCHYIQISNYGLYHLGHDICNFGVPEFKLDQQIRIRIKIHSRRNTKGFCDLSVTAACQPKQIKQLAKSKYSLDHMNTLPIGLSFTY